MTSMMGRGGRRMGQPAATHEFVVPPHEVVAAHYDDLAVAGRVRVHVLLSREKEGRYVTVLTVGRRSPEPHVRVQSDCGDQLQRSLARMRAVGSGILIYLEQEGRGAGLVTKALAYELAQRLQFDTFGAYSHLGLEQDRRSYIDAVRVLKLLDVDRCVLLTNNPEKVKALEEGGITTKREALWLPKGPRARRLRAARRDHGYLD
ncbi:MAG: hypothetical protein E6J41_17755 [Chloroflexi bacterium]|nr:MAG: hypothetical protein E6J41_17755 [Chloroflexota bacterium]